MKKPHLLILLLIVVAAGTGLFALHKHQQLKNAQFEVESSDREIAKYTKSRDGLDTRLVSAHREIPKYDDFLVRWNKAFSITDDPAQAPTLISEIGDTIQGDLRNRLSNAELVLRIDRNRIPEDERRNVPAMVEMKARATSRNSAVLYNVLLKLEESFPQSNVLRANISQGNSGATLEWEARIPVFEPIKKAPDSATSKKP